MEDFSSLLVQAFPNEIGSDEDLGFIFDHLPYRTFTGIQEEKKSVSMGESFEHTSLGDNLWLKDINGEPTSAKKLSFTLPNGLQATYGQIQALSGDYFATLSPISDGATESARQERFSKAWETLAKNAQAKEAAAKVTDIIQKEEEAVCIALLNNKQPSTAYPHGPVAFLKSSIEIQKAMKPVVDYARLHSVDWDHFGEDGHLVYNTGHEAAIQYAMSGDSDLHLAYAMNAFADHFLTDAFSAGHMRTPRREFPNTTYALACAKYMHDEDSAIGIKVCSPRGNAWMAYGDTYFLDKVNEDNMNFCTKALQASADEVYKAWSRKTAPKEFQAKNYVPTLESARDPHQELSPLFKLIDGKIWRRKNVRNRRDKEFTASFSYAETLRDCLVSGLWNYPMSISGKT